MIVSRSSIRTTNVKESLNLDIFKKFIKCNGGRIEDTVCDNLYIKSLKYLSNPIEKNTYAVSMTMLIVHLIESNEDDFNTIMNARGPKKDLDIARVIIKYCKHNKGSISKVENDKHRKSSEDEYITVIKRYCTEYFFTLRQRRYIDELLALCKSHKIISSSSEMTIKPWLYLTYDSDLLGELDDEYDEVEMEMKLSYFCRSVIKEGRFHQVKALLKEKIKIEQ